MKNLFLILLIVLSANSYSQINKTKGVATKKTIVKKDNCENVVAKTFKNKNTRNLYSLIITFNESEESNFNYKLDDEFYKDFKTNAKKVDSYLRKKMGDNYHIFAREGGTAECITNCHIDFTDENGGKIKGRGACKAGCWGDLLIDILDRVDFTAFL